jgi:V/A-type H+-transporting ATPase subunit C
MALKYSDYMYSCARIRALENTLLSSERLDRMVEAKSADEIFAVLLESGIPVISDGDGRRSTEMTFDNLLAETLKLLDSISPDPALFVYLRYPFDAANLKSALKALFSGREDDGIFFGMGSLSIQDVKNAVEDMDFTKFPEHMCEAAYRATDLYSEKHDPQLIDLVIDNACYADMLACARKDEFLAKLLKVRIDLTNLVSCLRFIRFGHGYDEKFKSTLLPGGEISEEKLCKAYDGGVKALIELIHYSGCSKLEAQLSGDSIEPGQLEKHCDDYFMEILREAKYINFGAGVLAAYYFAREYEVKNLRIIFAGKAAGLTPDEIRERMRAGYV